MPENILKDTAENQWNLKQLAIVSITTGAFAFIMANSQLAQNESKKNNNAQPNSLVLAILKGKDTYKGLPIKPVGNQKNLDTIRDSGVDGVYYFQEGRITTYSRIVSGVIETNTFETQ